MSPILGKSKADLAFSKKVDAATERRDWETVEQAFSQYGTYLELVSWEEA